MWYIFQKEMTKGFWFDMWQAGSKKIQIQRQTQWQIQRQIKEQQSDLWCYNFLERRWQKKSDYEECEEYAECSENAEYAE